MASLGVSSTQGSPTQENTIAPTRQGSRRKSLDGQGRSLRHLKVSPTLNEADLTRTIREAARGGPPGRRMDSDIPTPITDGQRSRVGTAMCHAFRRAVHERKSAEMRGEDDQTVEARRREACIGLQMRLLWMSPTNEDRMLQKRAGALNTLKTECEFLELGLFGPSVNLETLKPLLEKICRLADGWKVDILEQKFRNAYPLEISEDSELDSVMAVAALRVAVYETLNFKQSVTSLHPEGFKAKYHDLAEAMDILNEDETFKKPVSPQNVGSKLICMASSALDLRLEEVDMPTLLKLRRSINKHFHADEESKPNSSQHSFYLGHELNVLLDTDIRGEAYALYNSLVEEGERLEPMDENGILKRPSLMANCFNLVLQKRVDSVEECSDPKLLTALAAFSIVGLPSPEQSAFLQETTLPGIGAEHVHLASFALARRRDEDEMDMGAFESIRGFLWKHFGAEEEDEPNSSKYSVDLGNQLNALLGMDIREQAYALYNTLVEEGERLATGENGILTRPSLMASCFSIVLQKKVGSIETCSDPKLLATLAAFDFDHYLPIIQAHVSTVRDTIAFLEREAFNARSIDFKALDGCFESIAHLCQWDADELKEKVIHFWLPFDLDHKMMPNEPQFILAAIREAVHDHLFVTEAMNNSMRTLALELGIWDEENEGLTRNLDVTPMEVGFRLTNIK